MDPSQWRTYLVTQQDLSAGRATERIVEAALAGGVDVVQLREKHCDARERYRLGERLRALTDDADAALIVNDRIDLAAAVDADGVHLGRSDLPIEVAREQLGDDAVIGCSASTIRDAEMAAAAGADYLGVGAVYGTSSKDVNAADDGIGPERVRAVTDAVSIPVFGIGGIGPDNAAAVVDAGATGVAVISAITAAADPESATTALRDAVVTDDTRCDRLGRR